MAVKHLKAMELQRNEIRALRRQLQLQLQANFPKNDFIVPLYLGLLMELAPGGSLPSYVRASSNPLEESLQLEFMYDIARGMRTSHKRHILHGNLNSSKVLVYPNNRLKVCDLGLSKISCNASDFPRGDAREFSSDQTVGHLQVNSLKAGRSLEGGLAIPHPQITILSLEFTKRVCVLMPVLTHPLKRRSVQMTYKDRVARLCAYTYTYLKILIGSRNAVFSYTNARGYAFVLGHGSFVVVYFEVATGAKPFPGMNPRQLIWAVKVQQKQPQISGPYSPPNCVKHLMKNCWRHHPAERSQGFTPMVRTLYGLVSCIGDPCKTHAPHARAESSSEVDNASNREFARDANKRATSLFEEVRGGVSRMGYEEA